MRNDITRIPNNGQQGRIVGARYRITATRINYRSPISTDSKHGLMANTGEMIEPGYQLMLNTGGLKKVQFQILANRDELSEVRSRHITSHNTSQHIEKSRPVIIRFLEDISSLISFMR